MSCERAPSFLGAYVLGALERDERRAAERHLADCPACAAELEAFRGLTAQLDRVPAEEVTADPVTPSPELFGRVAAEVRRPARRRALAVAVAGVVLVGGGATWAAVRETGQVHTATADGVRMSVTAEEREEGSALDVTVEGLPAKVECRLVVVDEDGDRHEAGDWTTYGGEVSYRMWTEVPPDEVADVRLLGSDGDELVRVPFED